MLDVILRSLETSLLRDTVVVMPYLLESCERRRWEEVNSSLFHSPSSPLNKALKKVADMM